MWHAPNQRTRAQNQIKKREREKQRHSIHLKRITAHLEPILPTTPPSPLVQARLLINDLSLKGIGLYSSAPLIADQEIHLTISEPGSIKIRCRIVWCQDSHAGSHILTQQAFNYRIGLEFIFTSDEQNQFIEFCKKYLNHSLGIDK